jgi:hypothetical protein
MSAETQVHLNELSVEQLEALVNDCEARKQAIRSQQMAVQAELSRRTSKEKVEAMIKNMSKDDLKALAQVISGAGGIDAKEKVGTPGGQ